MEEFDLSIPVVVALMIIACLLIYFVFIELLKTFGDDVPHKALIKEEKGIEFLKFPANIEKMTEFLISSIVRKIYEVYVKFDYKNATDEQLNEKEWHSWQVSMLLKLYKFNQEFYIPNQKEVFPESILEMNLKFLEDYINSLIIKYDNNVDISKSKDLLCSDVIWTTRDVSILFYYLSKYREL